MGRAVGLVVYAELFAMLKLYLMSGPSKNAKDYRTDLLRMQKTPFDTDSFKCSITGVTSQYAPTAVDGERDQPRA